MDIVDAQVHANMLGTEVTLAIMDALGIAAVLFDEFDGPAADGALLPGYRLSNGAFRTVGPNAEAAAIRHPERFAFLMRVDPTDPGIECWVETLSAAPGCKALRTLSSPRPKAGFSKQGGHDRLLKTARAHGLPVFVTCPGRVPHLAQYVQRFPDVQFVIDHCGAAFERRAAKPALTTLWRWRAIPTWPISGHTRHRFCRPSPTRSPTSSRSCAARLTPSDPSASCGPATTR